MDKKLVKFSLADGVKSVAPAGYVESLEKLVNDIMIPRELEKMCTQEGRVYNYNFADYQKMARDIWGDTKLVRLVVGKDVYCLSPIGGFGHEGFGGCETTEVLNANVDGVVYQAQERDLPLGLNGWSSRLNRFANKDNARLRWLVKNLLVQQPGYQELRKKMGLQPVCFGPKDEIKAIYNVQNGGHVDSSVYGVFASMLDEAPCFREWYQEKIDELGVKLRELAPLLCDGSVIVGDASRIWIYALCPGCSPFSLIGESNTKYSVRDVMDVLDEPDMLKLSMCRLACSMNDVVDYFRVKNGIMTPEHSVQPVNGAKIHSDVYDVVEGLKTECLVKDLRVLASKLDGDAVLGADKTTSHVFVDHPSFKYGPESVLGVANYKLPTSSVVGDMNRIARAGGVDGFANEINNRIAFYKKLKLNQTNTKQR